jgi:hypothetical protein
MLHYTAHELATLLPILTAEGIEFNAAGAAQNDELASNWRNISALSHYRMTALKSL